MQPREKMLLVAIAVVVASYGGYRGYRAYCDTLVNLDQEIAKAEKSLQDVDIARQDMLRRGTQEWMNYGRQTISMNANEAKNLLRDELFAMADQSQLKETMVVMGDARKLSTHGVQRLGCQFSALGNLDQIVAFLYSLQSQPYLLRPTSTSVSPPTRKDQAGQLVLRLGLETLILPPAKLVPKVTPASLDADKRQPMLARLVMDSVTAYQSSVTSALFEAWKPPAPPIVTGPNPTNGQPNVAKHIGLSWKASEGATTYKVYFGESSPGAFHGEQPGTTFQPPQPLADGKQYFWRVDAVNVGGETPGETWMFTTKAQVIAAVPTDKPPPPVVAPVQPPPPPADAALVIGRIISSPRGQEVVLENPTNPNTEDVRKQVGESLYGGTLIFVHPKGAVSQKDQVRLFHPVGMPLNGGKPLSLEEMPEVFDAVQKLEARAAAEGISQRPG